MALDLSYRARKERGGTAYLIRSNEEKRRYRAKRKGLGKTPAELRAQANYRERHKNDPIYIARRRAIARIKYERDMLNPIRASNIRIRAKACYSRKISDLSVIAKRAEAKKIRHEKSLEREKLYRRNRYQKIKHSPEYKAKHAAWCKEWKRRNRDLVKAQFDRWDAKRQNIDLKDLKDLRAVARLNALLGKEIKSKIPTTKDKTK